MLSNEWIVPNFYPIAYLPKGVRLTAYGGESADLPAEVLQRYLDKVASGQIALGPTNVYRFDAIRTAHTDLEHNRAVGKLVVCIDPSNGLDPSYPIPEPRLNRSWRLLSPGASTEWDRDLRCAAHQLGSRILPVLYKRDDAGYQAVVEISGGCRWPRCHIPILGCLASGARALVLGGAAVALFIPIGSGLRSPTMSSTERSTHAHLPVTRFLSDGVPARLVMLHTWQR
jgi:hypothetical protein